MTPFKTFCSVYAEGFRILIKIKDKWAWRDEDNFRYRFETVPFLFPLKVPKHLELIWEQRIWNKEKDEIEEKEKERNKSKKRILYMPINNKLAGKL